MSAPTASQTGPAAAAPMATTTDIAAAPTAGSHDVAVIPTASRPRGSRWGSGELWTRLATVVAVVTVALIAGTVSYKHMAGVAREHGEDRVTAAIVPISVDGLIVAASLTLLAEGRAGRRRSPLPYALLALASAASVAANVMHAQPDLAARVIAAWPSAALIGSYELLMSQIRGARPRPARTSESRRPSAGGTPCSMANFAHPTGDGLDGGDGNGAYGRRHPAGGQHAEPTVAARDGSGGAATDPPGPDSTPPAENSTALRLRECQASRPDSGTEWETAPALIPPAVLAQALHTARRGRKRARLAAALLRDVAPDDPRTDYALARDLAPRINLHAGTARRYLSEWRRQAAVQFAAP